MGTKDTSAAPSEEEVRAAQELLNRHAAAQRERDLEAVRPILDLATSESFNAVLDAINGLDAQFLNDERIGPQLMAARTGLRGLADVAGRMVPPAPPVALQG